MSTAKENPCRKFQANIFNKSKCQNCFKPRELHLLTDQDLTQAKPIYGGWLCLAPEGTDFDNPMQRSRKWQRRFFVLYEHGCLRFALDESRSTLPQGTVNMNLCTDVIDAEPKTGQKNALCIITPEQEYFIRGENKEIINGWSEQLVVYPKTNKQNQKKKRKVEPATTLEPGPAKVAVTGSGIPEADPGPDSSSIIWQEELSQREVDGASVWSATDLSPLGSLPPPAGDAASVGSDAGSLNGDDVDRAATTAAAPALGSAPPYGDPLSPTGSCSSLGGVPRCPSPAPSDPFPSGSSLLSNGSHISGSLSSLDSDASGSTVTSNDSHPAAQRGAYPPAGLHHDTPRARRLEAEARKAEKRSRARSPERRQRPSVLSPERSRSAVIEKLEALELENAEKMEVEEAEVEGREARQGRSEHRRFNRQGEDPDFPSTRPPLRRAKSLDRRTTDSVMTPDLLNFKKGWMVKLEEHGQWKKYWFVLTDHSLRYYKDSIAEEASDLDGEIELSTCYNVTEYQAQRNYGFQIHTQEGVHTLSAMTAGIRRNWIQAVMKNVRPSTAPDVASSADDHGAFTPLDGLVRPDVTQDSPCSSEASSVAAGEREAPPGLKKSRALERRRGGRSKTFDWAEFRPIAQALAQQRAQQEAEDGLSGDAADPERSRRREERRRRYDTAAGPPSADEAGRMDCESVAVASVAAEAAGANPTERRQRVEEVIEQHWQQVEKTPLREEKRVPLPAASQPRDTAELEKLLESYKKGVDDLKTQLEGCHQQLVDSSQHKQELEVQLRTALEREHDVRSGYISPLENPMGLEADLAPHTTRAELVSSQAQSLTKKYQETKELLQLQELKKRNMQAQLGLSLSHLAHADPCPSDPPRSPPSEGPPPEPVQKTVSFVLSDSAEGIQELEDLITGRPVSLHGLQRLLQSHSCSQERGEQGHYQKLLARWKHQQDVENETIKKSLLRAGESIRDYETRLLTMEDMVGKAQRQTLEGPGGSYGPSLKTESETSNDMAIGMLSQRLELLTGENGALNQRYQEIVNQLTEADREIDRLKAELAKLQVGKQQRLLEEELARVKAEVAENQAVAIDREYYERELNERSLRLHEALVTLEELGNTLRDTEKKLQLREATLKGLGFQAAAAFEEDEGEDEMRLSVGQLKELLEASEAKLFENEAIIKSAEQRCSELEAQKCELMIQKEESEKVVIQKLREAGDEIRMLQERVGKEVKAGRDEPTMHVGKEAMQTCETQVVEAGLLKQVVDDIGMKSDALSAVVEMFGHVDMDVEKIISDLKSTLLVTDYLCSSQEEVITVNQKRRERLVLEAEFWGHLLTIKDSGKDSVPDFGRHVAVRVMAERSLLFLTRRLCPRANADENCDAPVTETDFSAMFTWLDKSTNALIFEELRQTLEEKANILKQIVTTIDLSKDDKLRSLALKTFYCEGHQKRPSEYLLDALKDAYMLYVTIRLQLETERDRMHTHAEPQTGSVDCGNCPKLREINRELNSKLMDLQTSLSGATVGDAGGPLTRIQIEGEPVDPLDKTIELQDMIARHRKELRDVKDAYEQEAETLRRQVVKAGEALHLRSEENVREIDSLTACMESLKRKHHAERNVLLERFEGEMEELRSAATPPGPAPGATDGSGDAPSGLDPSQTLDLKERIQQLVAQVSAMTGEMSRRERQGGATALRMKYEKDLENLKATCERGFAAMEESHQKVIEELQRKHQRELENLQEDKDRLLAEETAATIAAIEAMRNAHRSELEKELDKARKTNNHAENADLDEIHRQHEEELCSFQREIEVLSEQYSQKCLENAHLAQALEAERQALRQCQRENQELNAHNQELNNRLAAEITKMRSMASEEGESGVSMHGKELYELEVMLRVKESEVQYLKQEINSLKEELQAAQRDKKYATDKYKDIYTELSIVKAKAERDLGRLRDQLQLAHEALGEPSLEEVERGGYDIMKSKSNPDILKMAAAAAKRSERTLRSKSLKEGLTAEQRLHLFDNKDAKEF